MRRTRTLTAVAASAALTAVGLASAPTANAATQPAARAAAAPSAAAADAAHRVITDEVVAPFQLAATSRGVYVADGFTNTLSLLKPSGAMTVVQQGTGSEIAGVDATDDGSSVAWLSTTYPSGPTEKVQSSLTIRTQGQKDVVANLARYERTMNPDSDTRYGILAGGNACAREVFKELTGLPATYRGVVDSHPYSVARWGDSWVVAEAAGNTLLKVSASGEISTLAVLPPQPVKITQAMADAVGAPDCIVGVTYAFESVPTDVEVDYQGNLVATTLPGGPESPAFGARGSVYKVNASSGRISRIATGFLGATNVAVAPDGLYVSELFSGRITKVAQNGTKSTFRQVASPLSLEVRGGWLYAGTMADIDFQTGEVKSPGTVQRFWIL